MWSSTWWGRTLVKEQTCWSPWGESFRWDSSTNKKNMTFVSIFGPVSAAGWRNQVPTVLEEDIQIWLKAASPCCVHLACWWCVRNVHWTQQQYCWECWRLFMTWWRRNWKTFLHQHPKLRWLCHIPSYPPNVHPPEVLGIAQPAKESIMRPKLLVGGSVTTIWQAVCEKAKYTLACYKHTFLFRAVGPVEVWHHAISLIYF